MTIGHDGAVLTFQGYTPAEALEGAAVDEMPVSGDVLTKLHADVTGYAVNNVEGQLWR